MPKDKTESHIKINQAMKAEFLEKGFAGASIRSIGDRAGMTSAALYRHYASKEDMFRLPSVMQMQAVFSVNPSSI